MPADPFDQARAVLFAAEHGIAANGVAGHPAEATGQLARLVIAGRAPATAVAAGTPLRVVDVAIDEEADPAPHRVRRGSGRIDIEDALSRDENAAALAAGMAVADEVIAAGGDLLVVGTIGVAAGTPAAALISVLTDTEPVKVVGRGSGVDDDGWIRKSAAVRDARRRAWPYRDDPQELLATAGGADPAALVGLIVQAARRRTPVLLGGLAPAPPRWSRSWPRRGWCAGCLPASCPASRRTSWRCVGWA